MVHRAVIFFCEMIPWASYWMQYFFLLEAEKFLSNFGDPGTCGRPILDLLSWHYVLLLVQISLWFVDSIYCRAARTARWLKGRNIESMYTSLLRTIDYMHRGHRCSKRGGRWSCTACNDKWSTSPKRLAWSSKLYLQLTVLYNCVAEPERLFSDPPTALFFLCLDLFLADGKWLKIK